MQQFQSQQPTDLAGFSKYYRLEADYLEQEVVPAFHRNGFLEAKQFFAIVEWKVPRFGKTKLAYLTDEDIKTLTLAISRAPTPRARLEILLRDGEKSRRGIKLAMASAILTMLYDKEFTVYDIRVRKQLCKFGKWDEKACTISVKNPEGREPLDITNDKEVVDIYFDKYLPSVRELQVGQSLRDCDRALWAKDWSEDLDEFLRTRK